jgi:hypothetical protein
VHGVLTCLPTAAAVQDLQRLFYEKLNCGLSHENEPPPMLVFNLVAPHICIKNLRGHAGHIFFGMGNLGTDFELALHYLRTSTTTLVQYLCEPRVKWPKWPEIQYS